ncbi:MAG: peptidoglycan DD-metalloendopeptidase family protein, partial [Gemmiger sp.]
AAVVLVVTIRNGLDTRYILEVLVNGESVGYVANEQVFERARENVQSRINNAKTEMLSNGARVDDTGWAINPTYVLATEGEPMTENDMTDAILRASSDEISDATAVYIDGTLCYVTTEGDHLRSFLENIRAPYEDALDSTKRVEFLHNIELVDGVYFTSSIRSYDSIIASLREGAVPTVYIAEQGDTLETVLENTGLTFEELQQFNPQVEDETYQVTEGESLTVARGSSPLLQVKTIVRSSEQAEIAYERVQQESDQYSYGKLVTVQEGQNGLEERTYDTTYINGVATDQNLVQVVRLVEPVTEIVYKGTKISAGMYASTGSENWVWPVPQYSYVSRWMSSGHKGADICAPYGVDVIAADNGVVVTAGWHYSYGNYVVINHGNGWQTLYGHMSALYVSAGQAVQRGQAIGAIGSTGNSTGNHCHFEMYHNGALYSARNIFSGMG